MFNSILPAIAVTCVALSGCDGTAQQGTDPLSIEQCNLAVQAVGALHGRADRISYHQYDGVSTITYVWNSAEYEVQVLTRAGDDFCEVSQFSGDDF